MRVFKIALLLLFVLLTGVADAGCFGQRGFFQRRVHYQPTYYNYNYLPVRQAQPTYTYQNRSAVTPTYTVQTTTVTTTFLAQLNATRARYGLSAVAIDVGMVNSAAVNNSYQLTYGMGHHYMGAARRQNAAMGQSSETHVFQSWMASPGHQAALLDPSIRVIGLHRSGSAWTFSAR